MMIHNNNNNNNNENSTNNNNNNDDDDDYDDDDPNNVTVVVVNDSNENIDCNDNDNNNNKNDDNVDVDVVDDNDDDDEIDGIQFIDYKDESQLDHVMSLVGRDLSEPYSIFTYRYFLHRFPQLCILAVPIKKRKKKKKKKKKKQFTTTTTDDNDNNDNYDNVNDDDDDCQEEEEEEFDDDDDSGIELLEPIGCVVGKVDDEEIYYNGRTIQSTTGYIGMLAVQKQYRRLGIGKILVKRILSRMKYHMNCTSVTLETEVTNTTAQSLYQNCFGFIREELLVRYYLNWNDAYRLRLWF